MTSIATTILTLVFMLTPAVAALEAEAAVGHLSRGKHKSFPAHMESPVVASTRSGAGSCNVPP